MVAKPDHSCLSGVWQRYRCLCRLDPPTAQQEQTILQTWGSAVPKPAFDCAYSWGVQGGDSALVNTPSLQAVFAQHNAT
jgi:hypothetical protein